MLLALNGLNVTLTLPGIAGIILSIGMAVDANCIIFTRIREELATGKTVASAIDNGFSKAMSAIIDGNVTTLIAALVLYLKGSGTVKGFAMTLGIGIVSVSYTHLDVYKRQVMQRPDYLRDPSKIKKVMFMFMTQRMQNGGILYDAACNLHAKNQNGTKEQKKQARKEFAWAVSSQLVSAAVLSTMTFLARGLLHKVNPYRDDENELTTESVMSEWMNGVLGSLSGSFIGGNELYNLCLLYTSKDKAE